MNWTEIEQSFQISPENSGKLQTWQFDKKYKAGVPQSYLTFLESFGPGTLGDFFDFLPPHLANTHEERLEPFMDEELKSLIDEGGSGDILIFATTANGDMFGWKLTELRLEGEPQVYQIPAGSFDCTEAADDVKQFIEQLISSRPTHLENMPLIHKRV